MTEPSLKQGQGQYCALDLKVLVCATHDTQRTSQPAKKREFLLQKYRGEDGGDDDGQGSKRGLGKRWGERLVAETGPAWERGEIALTTTIASTKA